MNERYGDGWRYDVIDRRREGNEIIVLCKLVIDEGEVTKAQFGSARVGGGGTPTAGSAGRYVVQFRHQPVSFRSVLPRQSGGACLRTCDRCRACKMRCHAGTPLSIDE